MVISGADGGIARQILAPKLELFSSFAAVERKIEHVDADSFQT
jgi:hypothetical protein